MTLINYKLSFAHVAAVKSSSCPRHFRRWAGLHAHTRKKNRHVNGTTFQSALRFQIGLSSLKSYV